MYQAFGQLKVREQIPELVKKTQYQLITKVIGQRDKGIDGSGQKITPSYASSYYSKFKASLNPAPGFGTPDGKVTGLYNSELSLDTNNDTYTIDSAVDYAQAASLVQYGNNFNLPDDQSKEEYWDETLAPEIQDYIRNGLGI